ncbi:MAG: YraN family protein [Thermodesulfobacteriota bacterium]|jgi:putative endonuclease
MRDTAGSPLPWWGRETGLEVTETNQGDGPKTGKRELGKRGEEVALRFLKKKGYRVIERNYVCKLGEMDIVAKEKDTLVFVEVKTRTSTAFGLPQLAVNSSKQNQLSKVALHFLKEKKLEDVKARFDVVAILLGTKGEQIELIRDAFDLQYR